MFLSRFVEDMADHVSRDDFGKFLASKGAIQKCEVCGSPEGWIISDQGHQRIVGLFNPRPQDGGYVMPSGIIPAIVLVCKNCFHIRLFSEVLVAQALEEADGDGG